MGQRTKESRPIIFLLNHKLIGTTALSILFFVFLGTPTALVPNPFIHYTRMTPITWLDYFFLSTTSALLSINLIFFLGKKTKKEGAMLGGGFLGFLAFACPICNMLLVSLVGATFVLAFIEPLRPFFGAASIIILLATLYFQLKQPPCTTCADDNEVKITG